MQKENSKAIVMLIFTFVALSILGLFAINPTLTTIIELQKQLEESESVHQQLKTKMNNLSNLQEQYTTLSDDLVYVYDAFPKNADAPKLVAQLYALAEEEDLQISSLTISPVLLSDQRQKQKVNTHNSFTFTLEAEGTYETLINFTKSITNFNRIVTIESIAVTKSQKSNTLIMTIQGREYFKK